MISYVGGKYRQAKWISSFMPKKMDKYVEVFGGAFWVYLKSDFVADDVVYNDANPFMANLFACCTQYDKFLEYIDSCEAQDSETFNKFKDEVVERFKTNDVEIPDFDLGMKYAYVATQTFSGIIKQNSKMVDLKGKYKPKYYSMRDRLRNKKIREKLDKIRVTNLSYEDVFANEDDGNMFAYLDPPYYGTEDLYGFHSFTKEDHRNLVSYLKQSNSHWILSYYEFPELTEWFPKDQWHWEEKDYSKSSMASKGKGQSVGTEVLVMNFSNESEKNKYIEKVGR